MSREQPGPLTDAEAKRFGVMISPEGIIHSTSLEIAEAFRRLQGVVAWEQERTRAVCFRAWQEGWVVGWNHFPDSQNPYAPKEAK